MGSGTLEGMAGRHGESVFLAGAGGSGMRGLATFFLAAGWQVWGADRAGFDGRDPLLRLGLRPLSDGHLPPPVSLAVRSVAVPESDPAFAAAVGNGAEPLRYAEALGRISMLRKVLAVAGSHGKTTTTAWIAYGLRLAGVEVGYLVGATVPQLGLSAAWGRTELPLIVESCEYDRSFLQLSPFKAALLNVDAEHPDTYPGGLPEVTAAFRQFVARVDGQGRVFAGPEAPDLADAGTAPWEWAAPLPAGTVIGLPGEHNRRNAALVALVLRGFGLRGSQVRNALAGFKGASRRLEELGHWEGVRLISDYAHHPTEVAAALQAVGERYPHSRTFVVFQPHQALRFRAYQQHFAAALAPADGVLLMEVYRVRDPEDLQASVSELLPYLPSGEQRPVAVVENREQARKRIRDWARPGDTLLFLGAGDIDDFARNLTREAVSSAAF